MKRFKQKETIFKVLAVILLFLALLYQRFANQQDILKTLQQGEPSTSRFEKISGEFPTYQLWDDSGAFLGYGVIAEASGYGGKVAMLSIVDSNGIIKNVTILKDNETPVYKNRVLAKGLLEEIRGRNIQDSLAGLDGVSGATMTTEAILTAVRKGTTQVGNGPLGLTIPSPVNHLTVTWKDITAFILLLLAIFGSAWRNKKMRPWLLVLSVIFIGFLFNYSLTVDNYVVLFTGQSPVWIERPLWFVFVPGILLLTLGWGRNFYCSWLCPFGAVQEGIFNSLNLFHFSPSEDFRKKVRKVRWPMLWSVTIVALISNHPGVAGYEPFSAFFDSTGNAAQWIILGIAILMSMLVPRFYCQDFCPTGLVLNGTVHIHQNLRRRYHHPLPVVPAVQESSLAPQRGGSQAHKAAEIWHDKVYIIAASAVNLLIIVSLLENLGIL